MAAKLCTVKAGHTANAKSAKGMPLLVEGLHPFKYDHWYLEPSISSQLSLRAIFGD
jgi:hypothetical protein